MIINLIFFYLILVKKPSVFKGSFRIYSFIRSGNRYNTFQVVNNNSLIVLIKIKI